MIKFRKDSNSLQTKENIENGGKQMYDLNEICSHFKTTATAEPYGNGHINDTYLCHGRPDVILQRINTDIFKNPDGVMENIRAVTKHVRKKYDELGNTDERATLTVIETKEGGCIHRTEDGSCFRMYAFIKDSIGIDFPDNNDQLFEAGKAFGTFQRMLDDFPADTLFECIPNFHNTPIRVQNLKNAAQKDVKGRLAEVQKEYETAIELSKYASKVTDGIADGSIPLRVTHNDTKLNNVLFDINTMKALCVIDLDTVMPGSILYDFGDALRFCATDAVEDETDLSRVKFNLDKFAAFAGGFLPAVGDCLTEKEVEFLPLSAFLMTYECGIRFLTDYLEGDTYFKIHREKHNLDRARNQLALALDMEKNFDKMQETVKKILNK